MSFCGSVSLAVLLSVLLLSPTSCGESVDPSVLELSNRNAEFAVGVYRAVAARSDDNVLLSPFALSAGLQALLSATYGSTREQLLQALSLNSLNSSSLPDHFQTLRGLVLRNDSALNLRMGVAVVPDRTLSVSPSYQELVRSQFGGEVLSVSYSTPQQAVDTINRWTQEQTGDQVQELLSDLDPQTQLLLTTATSCKVLLSPSSDSTPSERFMVDSYHVIVVPMMHRADRYFLAYDASLKVGVVRLPLVGGASAVSMLAVLPDEDVDIRDVEAELTAEKIRDWIRRLRKTRLEVQLPLLLLDRSYSLKEVLTTLGITQVFQDDADISGMGGAKGPILTEVYQKSAVSVSEAAADDVTAGGGAKFSTPPPRLTFNRPFLFIVYHQDSASLLLIGRVTDPTHK